MRDRVSKVLLGKRRPNEAADQDHFSFFCGIALFGAETISAYAYVSDEILEILMPVLGMVSFEYFMGIALGLVFLLILLTFSLNQIIDEYPGGGGCFYAPKDNLGEYGGLVSAATLIVTYVLAVAVCISAASGILISAFPILEPYRLWIALAILLLST